MNYEDRLITVDCERCGGTGGPPPIWDEDLNRSVTYVCGMCSGSGIQRVWEGEWPT